MSNGESKIAESKAALCCGFAIALRTLFIGDSLLGDSLPVECFALLAMTRKYFGGATLVALLLSLRASPLGERGNQPCVKLES